MLLQIFLLIILVFHPSSGKTPKVCVVEYIIIKPISYCNKFKLVKCPDIFANYQASLNVAKLLKQVSRWKIMIDKIEPMDYDDVAKDLEKCHEKVATLEVSEEQKYLAQYLVEAMQLHLTKHVAMGKLNKSLMDCAKNAESKVVG
jgi:hypothetical protein